MGNKTVERQTRPLPSLDTTEGINEVLARAGKGDADMLPLLRELFERHDERGKILANTFGNMYSYARDAMIDRAAGGSLALQAAIRRKIDAVRDDLAGPDPTPLEVILCERIALCWFDANESDRRYIDQSGLPFKDAEHQESRRDRAHRRFLAACKALAMIRKLGVPAIQVNVARQQVNVAGST